MPSAASSSEKKKKTTVSRSFLSYTNPEIFCIKPRFGGFIACPGQFENKEECGDDNVETEEEIKETADKKISAQENLQEQISREFRIQRTLFDSTWTLNTLNSGDESVETIEVSTPIEDSIDMLSISLSTVMLLAAGAAELPNTHVQWTKNYLGTIKDEFGHVPPNIQGILNHLAYLDAQGGGSGEGNRRGSKTVRTTTTVRRRSSEPKSAEGAAAGVAEGVAEGAAEGATEGAAEGATEGAAEGATEGAAEEAAPGATEETPPKTYY